ncbi:MAG TPA: FliH/SctL family protein [Steroidobacteraceae bacterium]|nr:FliH/SctL family protein [Steroidobacteraceae bacterium]
MSDSNRTRSPVAERWSLPLVDGPIVGMRRDSPLRERAREAEARASDAARQAEQDRGYEAGLKAAQAQMKSQTDALNARVARLDAILNAVSRPLPELETEVEQQLVLLALAVGKQIARRELKADSGQIAALIREAVGRLPAAARDVRVHLHPEDAAAIAERLATPGQERAWSIVEDPTLTRGGCLVRSENSQIDARLESRVNAIVSSMLGEERASARLADPSADSGVADS